MNDAVADTLREALGDAGVLLVLTGAGVSAESGVPTFRGPEGYWTIGSRNYHPQELATQAAFRRMPRDVWHWYLFRRAVCRAAQPNAAHVALAEAAERLGTRLVLVTQNVDGLHLRAGSPIASTLQIHGNIDYLRCADACTTHLVPLAEDFIVPDRSTPFGDDIFESLRCPRCGAHGRPHVLWFDEYYDEPLYRAESAMMAAHDAAALVVIGTAGATNLPRQIAALVARRGRPIVDINTEGNPFADLAEASGGHAVRETAASYLPRLMSALASTSVAAPRWPPPNTTS